MTLFTVFWLTILAALFNSILSIYITISKQHEYDNMLFYFAFIISCSAVIIDILYFVLS